MKANPDKIEPEGETKAAACFETLFADDSDASPSKQNTGD